MDQLVLFYSYSRDSHSALSPLSLSIFPSRSLSPAFTGEEDGNGRVLDTGLRGDPPALRVLDALLEANEFLLGSGEAGAENWAARSASGDTELSRYWDSTKS